MTDKARQAQIKRLEVQLKKPENRECFDCTSKQPRWASTNLGIFMCLRCAGIHRSLGVHITKVKSTTMDAWEEHMIRTAERIGNGRGKLIYEATFKGPKCDVNANAQEVERMARRKYERKQYYAPNAEEMIQSFLNDEQGAAASVGTGTTSTATPQPVQSPSVSAPPAKPQLLVQEPPSLLGGPAKQQNSLDWGGFESSSTPSNSPATTSTPSQAPGKKDDFWDAFAPTSPPASNSNNNATPQQPAAEFGCFQQSPTTVPATSGYTAQPPLQQQQQQQQGPTSGGDFMSFQGGGSGGPPPPASPPAQQQAHTNDIMAAFGSGNGPMRAQVAGGGGVAGHQHHHGMPPPGGYGGMGPQFQHMSLPPHNPQPHLPPHHNFPVM